MLGLFLVVVLVATAAILILRGLVVSRGGAGAVAHIDAYGFRARQADDDPHFSLLGLVGSTAGRMGNVFLGRIPRLRQEDIRRRLVAAGYYRTDPRTFLGYQLLAALVLPLVVVLYVRAVELPVAVAVLAILGSGVLGFFLPLLWIRRKARIRTEKIEYELPELVDLLVVTIEAGVGFLGALQMAAGRIEGPLADELKLTLQEQRLGLSVTEALRNLMNRADTPSMRAFVRSVLQGEQLGVTIGQVMRNLALEMRKRRRAAAEERAQKAPIKILFPLVFLIFPAMFIVILGPAVIEIFKVLG